MQWNAFLYDAVKCIFVVPESMHVLKKQTNGGLSEGHQSQLKADPMAKSWNYLSHKINYNPNSINYNIKYQKYPWVHVDIHKWLNKFVREVE